MKAILVVLAALSLAACNKSEDVVTQPAPTPSPAVEATHGASTTPAAAAAPHLAPAGVYYLVSWVRIETADGLINLPPGTGVKLVKPGRYLSPSGEVQLTAKQITNDLDVARQAHDAYLAGKVAVGPRQAEPEMQAREKESQALPIRAAAPTSNSLSTGLDRQRLTAKLAELQRRKIDLQAQQAKLSQTQAREEYDRLRKRRIVTGTTNEQLTSNASAMQSVDQQIEETQTALTNLR